MLKNGVVVYITSQQCNANRAKYNFKHGLKVYENSKEFQADKEDFYMKYIQRLIFSNRDREKQINTLLKRNENLSKEMFKLQR